MIRMIATLLMIALGTDAAAQLVLEDKNGATGLRGNRDQGSFFGVSTAGYSGEVTSTGVIESLTFAYYLDAACTEGPYVSFLPAGSVFAEPSGSARGTASVVYIPVDAEAERLTGRKLWGGLFQCNPESYVPDDWFFRAIPNDPAVTGFRNSYEPPFRVRAAGGSCVYQDGFECPAQTAR